jgi:hypothetical protein
MIRFTKLVVACAGFSFQQRTNATRKIRFATHNRTIRRRKYTTRVESKKETHRDQKSSPFSKSQDSLFSVANLNDRMEKRRLQVLLKQIFPRVAELVDIVGTADADATLRGALVAPGALEALFRVPQFEGALDALLRTPSETSKLEWTRDLEVLCGDVFLSFSIVSWV